MQSNVKQHCSKSPYFVYAAYPMMGRSKCKQWYHPTCATIHASAIEEGPEMVVYEMFPI